LSASALGFALKSDLNRYFPAPIVITFTPIVTIIIPTEIADNTVTPTLNNDNFGLDYDYPSTVQAKGSVRIPVLTYHHIAPLPDNPNTRDYYVSPTIFEQQLIYLKQKNYKVLTIDEFIAQVDSGKNPTQKSVLLTFDDGNYDNYQYAFPLLKKYGYVGVFFIPTNKTTIGRTQLKEMADAGMIIGSHSKNHIDLMKETDNVVLVSEISGSRQILQNISGQPVKAFCYPGCVYSSQDVRDVKSAGYSLAFSCGTSIDQKTKIMDALPRMHVYNDMENFKKILSGTWEYPTHYSD